MDVICTIPAQKCPKPAKNDLSLSDNFEKNAYLWLRLRYFASAKANEICIALGLVVSLADVLDTPPRQKANEICIALGLIVSLPDRRLYEKLLNYDNQNTMENKLQQLTQKLYDEGLEKGRAEAERLVSEAKSEAAKIIADAKAEAEAIVKAAEAKAEDTAKNSMTEIALAGKQAVARIKEEISSLIAAESTFSAVKAANLDPEFVKAMLLSVARNWNGASSSKVELQALLPEAERAKFDAAFAAAAKELLEACIEVGYSKEVRTGFKVGAKGGSYYISFSDDDFEALLKEYLRGKISELLFKA